MGASFAAPMVSGSLALMMEHFRGTRGNAAIVRRMLDTADRTGVYANPDIYCAGRLDLGATLPPVGALTAGQRRLALAQNSPNVPEPEPSPSIGRIPRRGASNHACVSRSGLATVFGSETTARLRARAGLEFPWSRQAPATRARAKARRLQSAGRRGLWGRFRLGYSAGGPRRRAGSGDGDLRNVNPRNLVVIMSDVHSTKVLGCYGSVLAHTPHIDGLAARGTRFSNAYCCNPICIPARATFATGRYTHQIGYWDNADPYEGAIPSWHHHLRERGHRVESIGKLHFRSTSDDNGFHAERIPMHVIEGKGDLMGLVHDDLPVRKGSWKMAGMAGPGESIYTRYDRDIAAEAQIWLHEEAPKHGDKPWVLFVSFVAPHFPLTAPAEHFYRYYESDDLPWPKLYARHERPTHPFLLDQAGANDYDAHFDSEDRVRRGLAGYWGLCTFLDEQIGKVLAALEATGLAATTRVLYTSDHGDNLGARGLWGKSTMYEEAAKVPLIVAGEGIPRGVTVDRLVSHVDVYPFIMECAGEADERTITPSHPGVSLHELAAGADPDRAILSEYHAMGSRTGAFMVRLEEYKYVHYVAYPPHVVRSGPRSGRADGPRRRPGLRPGAAGGPWPPALAVRPAGGGRGGETAPVGAHRPQRRARRGHRPGGPRFLGAARGRTHVRLTPRPPSRPRRQGLRTGMNEDAPDRRRAGHARRRVRRAGTHGAGAVEPMFDRRPVRPPGRAGRACVQG